MIIVGSWKRGLGKIQLFEVNASGLNVVSPLMYMKDAKLPRDTKGNLVKRRKIVSIATAASEILSPDTSRFRETLSQFFNAPVVSLKQICSGKFDAVIQISYDLSNCITFTFNLHPELVDASPKTELSDLVWKLTG